MAFAASTLRRRPRFSFPQSCLVEVFEVFADAGTDFGFGGYFGAAIEDGLETPEAVGSLLETGCYLSVDGWSGREDTAEIFEGIDVLNVDIAKGDGWFGLRVEAIDQECLGLLLADVEVPGLSDGVKASDEAVETLC